MRQTHLEVCFIVKKNGGPNSQSRLQLYQSKASKHQELMKDNLLVLTVTEVDKTYGRKDTTKKKTQLPVDARKLWQ